MSLALAPEPVTWERGHAGPVYFRALLGSGSDMWQWRGPGRGRRSERRDIGHVIRAAETRGGDTPWSPPSDVRTTSGPRASLPAVCRCHTLLILSGKDVWGQPRHRRQEDQWQHHQTQWHSRHGHVWPSVMTCHVLCDKLGKQRHFLWILFGACLN